MDDFDRLLEFKLRRMLDAIVTKPPPVRGRRRSRPAAKTARDRVTEITARWTLFMPAELAPAVVVAQEGPVRLR